MIAHIPIVIWFNTGANFNCLNTGIINGRSFCCSPSREQNTLESWSSQWRRQSFLWTPGSASTRRYSWYSPEVWQVILLNFNDGSLASWDIQECDSLQHHSRSDHCVRKSRHSGQLLMMSYLLDILWNFSDIPLVLFTCMLGTDWSILLQVFVASGAYAGDKAGLLVSPFGWCAF